MSEPPEYDPPDERENDEEELLEEGLASVVLVEDIIERGATVTEAVALLEREGARSVDVCTLLWKPSAGAAPGRYVGFEVPDEFVVGYGLDFEQRYRNVPFIGVLDDAEKRAVAGGG